MDLRQKRWMNLHERFAAGWLLQRRAEAPALAEEELQAAQEAYGPEHPAVAQSLYDLSMARAAQQRGPESDAALAKAQALLETLERRAAREPDSCQTAELALFLADRLANLGGDDVEVQARYQQALSIRKRRLGPDHPETADVIARLAEQEYLCARFAQAVPLYRDALAIYEKAGDPDRPYFSKCLEGLALCL